MELLLTYNTIWSWFSKGRTKVYPYIRRIMQKGKRIKKVVCLNCPLGRYVRRKFKSKIGRTRLPSVVNTKQYTASVLIEYFSQGFDTVILDCGSLAYFWASDIFIAQSLLHFTFNWCLVLLHLTCLYQSSKTLESIEHQGFRILKIKRSPVWPQASWRNFFIKEKKRTRANRGFVYESR